MILLVKAAGGARPDWIPLIDRELECVGLSQSAGLRDGCKSVEAAHCNCLSRVAPCERLIRAIGTERLLEHSVRYSSLCPPY